MTNFADESDESNVSIDGTSVTITRAFSAPLERVFHVFADPDLIETWQTIDGLTVTINELDPKPWGDIFLDHEHGNTASDLAGEVVEVVENERIVYTSQVVAGEVDEDEKYYADDDVRHITTEFEERDDATELRFTNDRAAPEKLTPPSGTESPTSIHRMFDRLEELLSEP